MNEASIIQYITETFDDVYLHTIESSGNTFFFYDPTGMFPFATLVTNDEYDTFSDLNRPSVYRLNIGISKENYRDRFGTPAEVEARNYDYTALDQLMPHPVYGRQYWVCVLKPGEETFEEVVKPLLAEAYERDVAKHAKRGARRAAATNEN